MKGTCRTLLYIPVIIGIVISSCSMEDIEALERESDNPPSGCVMKFERKGGYLGLHDEFWIYSDGRVLDSEGKTARISPDLVTKWVEIISPAADPAIEKAPSFKSLGMLCMDCYIYVITVYDRDEAKVLSSLATDTYLLNSDDNISAINIGRIRDTLMNLPWE